VEHDTDDEEAVEALAQCEETVEQLKEENAQLRESAQTFGDLAERLNTKQRAGKHPGPEPPRTRDRISRPGNG
jgi:hypothetical protein